jgi:hypothetical protein
MAFLANHAYRFPLLGGLLRKRTQKFDFNRAWWTPPLPAADAFRLEAHQLHALGLKPIVSLTDHDSIDAARELQLLGIAAPVSVEWTVPYANSFLHIGVHNLPKQEASNWMRLFAFWTAKPARGVLRDIFAALDAMPGVLLIVNHPLWDEGGIGPDGQFALVQDFIQEFRPFLHALELNGLRSWRENRRVLSIAHAAGLPVVSGGDRHGCEPNANVNLTNARSFAEFAAEIRQDQRSQILFLPQYREPQNLRCAEAVRDTLRDYPEYSGRVLWSDRVFYRESHGRIQSLTNLWQGAGPSIVRNMIGALHVFQNQSVRTAFRYAFAERQEEPAA